MSSESGCCSFSFYFKVLLGALAVGLFVWLLMVGTPGTREFGPSSSSSWLAAGSSSVAVGSHVQQNHPQSSHLNFMSKVRVPKGPDPIHNRRSRINGRPPSRA